MNVKKKRKIDYKAKYYALKYKYDSIVDKNNVVQLLSEPTFDQRVKIIEDYFEFCSNDNLDCSHVVVFADYKKHLRKQHYLQ